MTGRSSVISYFGLPLQTTVENQYGLQLSRSLVPLLLFKTFFFKTKGKGTRTQVLQTPRLTVFRVRNRSLCEDVTSGKDPRPLVEKNGVLRPVTVIEGLSGPKTRRTQRTNKGNRGGAWNVSKVTLQRSHLLRYKTHLGTGYARHSYRDPKNLGPFRSVPQMFSKTTETYCKLTVYYLS